MAHITKTDNLGKILQHLAKNGEVSQPKLNEDLDIPYRSLIRYLKTLEAEEMIFQKGTKRVNDKGPPRNVWALSVRGLITAIDLFENDHNTVSDIIKENKEKSVLFEQWDYVTANKEVMDWALSNLSFFVHSKSRKKVTKKALEGPKEMQRSFVNASDRVYLSELYDKVFAIEAVLNGRFLFHEEPTWSMRVFNYCFENPVLREVIIQRLQFYALYYHHITKTMKNFDVNKEEFSWRTIYPVFYS